MSREEKFAKICETLQSGGIVQVCTHLKAWQFSKPEHVKFFMLSGNGLFMRRGKSWDCIDYSNLRFGKFVS